MAHGKYFRVVFLTFLKKWLLRRQKLADHSMNKRPYPVTVLSLIILAAGVVGLVYHLSEFNVQHPFQDEVLLVSLVRVIVIVCGVYMLRGKNCAHWLTLAWLAFHVVLSGFHSLNEFAMHAVILALFAYVLCGRQAKEYFLGTKAVG